MKSKKKNEKKEKIEKKKKIENLLQIVITF